MRGWRRIAAIVALNAAGLLLLEGAARLVLRFWRDRPPAVDFAHVEYRLPQYYERDPQLFWRLRPGVRIQSDYLAAQGVSGGIQINSRGLRGPEVGAAPPQTIRLVCLGDSQTFGWRVADGETYPAQLEAALNERRAVPFRIEVVNAGVPGYSSLQGYRWLRQAALPLRPHAVLLAFGANDRFRAMGGNDEVLATRAAAADATLDHLRLLERSRLVRLLAALVGRARYEWLGATRLTAEQTAKYACLMVEACREAGAGALLLPDDAPEAFLKAGRETGAPVRSLFPPGDFHRQPGATLPDDAHPSAAGYRLIAAYLADLPEVRALLQAAARQVGGQP